MSDASSNLVSFEMLNEDFARLSATALDIKAQRDALLAALLEASCWIPDGTRQTPEERGAKCETASEMTNLIHAAIHRAETGA